jgi:hypothetical protein
MLLKKNIINLFKVDTYVASVNGIKLESYMIKRHSWTITQYNEYEQIYRDYLSTLHYVITFEDTIKDLTLNKKS